MPGTIGPIAVLLISVLFIILEKSHAAIKLAEIMLKLVGKRFPGLAMSIIGYMGSIPVFCNSAYIILPLLKNRDRVHSVS